MPFLEPILSAGVIEQDAPRRALGLGRLRAAQAQEPASGGPYRGLFKDEIPAGTSPGPQASRRFSYSVQAFEQAERTAQRLRTLAFTAAGRR